jgi:uncharacterized membrane protein YgdD (TMEM256/DUF423 family)
MNKYTRFIITAGFISGCLAVLTGAFGAHYMHAYLRDNGRIDTYKTAVEYQFIHSVMLVLTGLLYHQKPSMALRTAAILFLAGLVLFSGSLYLVCFSGIPVFGIITPFGGIAFIAAWISGAWNFIRDK